ncbi:Tn3 family transposase [Caballeronia sp. SEWSISQ10-4 2]|uniref:Tn3 family transposase n=1 Tax=Caballeronia sp. SEWSISQ10-4 2 TaxID=2937438 RepID=UPI002656D72B|nr:Tn3 family transposase [Caballeronia sp. SEWSISQ10-4 2]MDN7183873.1 Tn3 family transposase [Caballeronia sp. SEWSISQ10-4 2]
MNRLHAPLHAPEERGESARADAAADRHFLDAFNLGLEKMADTCAGTSAAKLAWLVAWYIRDETHQKGSEELVNYLHGLPFTTYWGAGTTAPPITTTSFLSFILIRTSWRTASLRWNQMALRSVTETPESSGPFPEFRPRRDAA